MPGIVVWTLLHLDQKVSHATHQLLIGVPNTPVQAFSQALFSLKKEVQPSNEELPKYLLLMFLFVAQRLAAQLLGRRCSPDT